MPRNHILCYSSPIWFYNPKIQARKGLIIYNTKNGITTLKKHVDANHFNPAKMFEKEAKNPLRRKVERPPTKENQMDIYSAIIDSFVAKEPF
jgi:hypothetical protein